MNKNFYPPKASEEWDKMADAVWRGIKIFAVAAGIAIFTRHIFKYWGYIVYPLISISILYILIGGFYHFFRYYHFYRKNM